MFVGFIKLRLTNLGKNRNDGNLSLDGDLGEPETIFPHDLVIMITELSFINAPWRKAEKVTSVSKAFCA